MSINASAYMSETIRAAIDAVDKGQMDAAMSVGMTKKQAMIRIILPQAARIAIPPLGNTMISLIQGTAITFTLGVKEMMGQSKISAAASFRFLENFLAVGIIYWLLTLVLSYYTKSLEKEMNKGFR
jgi:putative amino-acid transport system permease protein